MSIHGRIHVWTDPAPARSFDSQIMQIQPFLSYVYHSAPRFINSASTSVALVSADLAQKICAQTHICMSQTSVLRYFCACNAVKYDSKSGSNQLSWLCHAAIRWGKVFHKSVYEISISSWKLQNESRKRMKGDRAHSTVQSYTSYIQLWQTM